MKNLYSYTIFWALAFLLLISCNKIERISAVRITNVQMLNDSLSAIVSGEIIDSEATGTVADHGFCFAEGYADLELGDEKVDTISLGAVIDENNIFSDTLLLPLPNATYYVRAYMIIDGKTVYGSPKAIRTRAIRIEDLNVGILSTVLAFGPTGSLTIRGFVNKKKIETQPVTLLDFGTIASYLPDSTTGHIILGTPTNDITYFSNTHTEVDLGTPPSANVESIYVWGFARYALNADPNDIRKIYTPMKVVNIRP